MVCQAFLILFLYISLFMYDIIIICLMNFDITFLVCKIHN